MEGLKTTAKGTIPLTAHRKAIDGLTQTIKRREKEIVRLEGENKDLKRDLKEAKSFVEKLMWEYEE